MRRKKINERTKRRVRRIRERANEYEVGIDHNKLSNHLAQAMIMAGVTYGSFTDEDGDMDVSGDEVYPHGYEDYTDGELKIVEALVSSILYSVKRYDEGLYELIFELGDFRSINDLGSAMYLYIAGYMSFDDAIHNTVWAYNDAEDIENVLDEYPNSISINLYCDEITDDFEVINPDVEIFVGKSY